MAANRGVLRLFAGDLESSASTFVQRGGAVSSEKAPGKAPFFADVRWIPTFKAAALLGTSPKVINQARARGALNHAVDQKGGGGRGRAVLFALDEVERLASIMDRCDVGLEIACRIKIALDRGGPL